MLPAGKKIVDSGSECANRSREMSPVEEVRPRDNAARVANAALIMMTESSRSCHEASHATRKPRRRQRAPLFSVFCGKRAVVSGPVLNRQRENHICAGASPERDPGLLKESIFFGYEPNLTAVVASPKREVVAPRGWCWVPLAVSSSAIFSPCAPP